jgi:dTDP-4-amino-4,6-dideoxygalactose transaminase
MDVHGVECNIHYPIPPHRQQAYRDAGFDFGSLPIAENLAGEVLSLPIGPHMTDAQVEATVAAVRSFDW